MKVFDEKTGSWSQKINFADERNVFVGYDIAQNCREYANWFIVDTEETTVHEEQPRDLDGWRFDPDYFESVENMEVFDNGGMVRFRLVNDDGDQKFLHLFNAQNGYYSHGFSMEVGGQTRQSGTL